MTSTAGSLLHKPVLAVNAAESRVQLVVAKSGEALGVADLSVPGAANEHMAPATAELLGGLGLAVADLGGVACVRGPGSFTGLRMSLAFCLGLARGANLPMAGLDYLPLLAAGPVHAQKSDAVAGPAGFAGLLAVWVRSRAGQVYTQHFEVAATAAPAPLGGPAALPLADAARLLAQARDEHPGPVAVIGSGSAMKGAAQALDEADLADAPLPEGTGAGWCDPRPDVLARAACEAAYGPEPPEPLYLRLSDAEENLDAIARSRGLDPDEAARRLAEATSGTGEPTA